MYASFGKGLIKRDADNFFIRRRDKGLKPVFPEHFLPCPACEGEEKIIGENEIAFLVQGDGNERYGLHNMKKSPFGPHQGVLGGLQPDHVRHRGKHAVGKRSCDSKPAPDGVEEQPVFPAHPCFNLRDFLPGAGRIRKIDHLTIGVVIRKQCLRGELLQLPGSIAKHAGETLVAPAYAVRHKVDDADGSRIHYPENCLGLLLRRIKGRGVRCFAKNHQAKSAVVAGKKLAGAADRHCVLAPAGQHGIKLAGIVLKKRSQL